MTARVYALTWAGGLELALLFSRATSRRHRVRRSSCGLWSVEEARPRP